MTLGAAVHKKIVKWVESRPWKVSFATELDISTRAQGILTLMELCC
jgi:hypothetical protein